MWSLTNTCILAYTLTYALKNLGVCMCTDTLCLVGFFLQIFSYLFPLENATFTIFVKSVPTMGELQKNGHKDGLSYNSNQLSTNFQFLCLKWLFQCSLDIYKVFFLLDQYFCINRATYGTNSVMYGTVFLWCAIC